MEDESKKTAINHNTQDEKDNALRKKQFAELLEKAKGENRSFGAYAKAAGVSPASLSRMLKGDFLPKPETVEKLTSSEANPQNGVTYDAMMSILKGDRILAYCERLLDISTSLPEDSSPKEIKRSAISERIMAVSLYEKEAISQIYTALAEKGMIFKKMAGDDVASNRRADLEIELIDQPVNKWIFEVKYYPKVEFGNRLREIYFALGQLVTFNVDSDTKLTLVVNDDSVFRKISQMAYSIAFRGELSVALYDIEKKCFLEEKYLSNYQREDHSKEFYLI